jgi:hypothetical protein
MRPPEGWRLDARVYSPESNGNQSHRLRHAASEPRPAPSKTEAQFARVSRLSASVGHQTGVRLTSEGSSA